MCFAIISQFPRQLLLLKENLTKATFTSFTQVENSIEIEGFNLIESDIYWVNTSKIFKPFVYNPLSDMTLQVGEHLELQIPLDYFKDIDDKELTLSINQNEFDWLEFDSERMKLSE